MSNSRKSKRAFTLSVLSVVLCIVMLVGTTFAWFTDSESAVNNIIKSGNLDVELLKANGSEITTTDNLFSADLWEPGHVEVVPLTVKNAGSLALKYNLKIVKTDETPGTREVNGAEEPFKLSNYIKYAVVDGKQDFGSGKDGRAAAIAAAEAANPSSLDIAFGKDGVLYEQNETVDLTLIAYMPTTVGNEANHKTGTEAPTITLGVNLLATQVEHEIDSFGNDYDASAPLLKFASTREELLDAIGSDNDAYVLVDSDIKNIYGITDTNTDAAKTVDFANSTITFNDESTYGFQFKQGKKTVTFKGDNGGVVAPVKAIWNSGETVTVNIEGGNYNISTADKECIYCHKGTINISGGFFEIPGAASPQKLLDCSDKYYKAGTAKIVVTGGTFVNFDPSNNTAEGANTSFVAEGYTVNSETQDNGDVWYTVVPA